MKIIYALCLCFFTLISNAAVPWNVWVQQLRAEAISQGIRPQLFDQIFKGMTPSPEHLQLDRKQPEKRLTYLEYRTSRVPVARIQRGKQEFKKREALLNEIGQHYGVSPCIITSLWGMESDYGNYMGKYPVIRSLATMAYDNRRGEFFRRELLYALHIVNDGQVKLKDYVGEWAGASGQPQFLPSSWYRYAVDYNGDGRKDIWHTYSDIFASIANYLDKNGWQKGQPLLVEVVLPSNFDLDEANLKIEKTVSEWLAMGIRPKGKIYNHNVMASIIIPGGGPAFMVFNNFKVIMKWNRSTYYAAAVSYLADKICVNNNG